MKKIKIMIFVMLFSVMAFIPLMLTGCSTPSMDRLGHLISELRENIFVGESDNFTITIVSGFREDPFLMDGIPSISRDFTLATLTPKSATSQGVYKFNITVDEILFMGEFLHHPFSNTLSTDLNIRASGSDIAVTITNPDGVEESMFAKSVLTDQMISSNKALEIAENKLHYSLETLKENGELQLEIFIRLMVNPLDNSGGYHWYVAFIGREQQIFAVLIDPISMQVVAIRN